MNKKIELIHPGEHLAEFLEDFGLSQYRLAQSLHVPIGRIADIVKGKRGISADTALRLARFFGTTAQFWLNLQSKYELEKAQISKGEIIQQDIVPLVA